MTRIALGNLDAAEALETILQHEHIGYERGVGSGFITFDVTSMDSLIVAQRLKRVDRGDLPGGACVSGSAAQSGSIAAGNF